MPEPRITADRETLERIIRMELRNPPAIVDPQPNQKPTGDFSNQRLELVALLWVAETADGYRLNPKTYVLARQLGYDGSSSKASGWLLWLFWCRYVGRRYRSNNSRELWLTAEGKARLIELLTRHLDRQPA